MNWILLKDNFPLATRELRRRLEKKRENGELISERIFIEDFLYAKGYDNLTPDFTQALKEYEQVKTIKIENKL